MVKKKGKGGSNTVGYGKPPFSSRFKPGQSGNTSGRPKNKPTLAGIVTAELDRDLPVTLDGRPQKMKLLTAMVKGITQRAIKGDLKAFEFLLSLYQPESPLSGLIKDASKIKDLTDAELTEAYLKAVKMAHIR